MAGEREGQIIAEVVRRAGTHPRRTEAAPHARGSDHPLPAQPTALLGRDAELDELSQALLSGMVRLLTLTGPAGVGKTRLGIELALSVRHAFPDGAVFVDLAGAPDRERVASTIAQAIGILEGEDTISWSALRDHLAEQRLLLLLDTVDHLLPVASEVGAIVTRCPQVAVVVTCRAPLHLRWEHVQPIAPLSLPAGEDLSVEEIEALPCVQLFRERAQAIRPDLTRTASTARDILAICRRLDGLPLAIELAAARSNILTPAAILSRLDPQDALLRQRGADIPLRHRSLEAAIDASYRVLTEREQALLRCLAVFVDGWTLEAALAVVSPDELRVDLLDGLSSLVDKSLVATRGGTAEEPRFVLLHTIDAYVLDQEGEAGELERARRNHCAYFLGLVDQAVPELRGPGEDRWLTRLEREYGNLRAALAWTGSTESEQELRLAIGLSDVLRAQGDPHQGVKDLSTALVRHPEGDAALRLDALDQLAHLLRWDNRFDAARTALDQGLTLARSRGSAEPLARLLMNEGLLLTVQGQGEAARASLDEALGLWQEMNGAGEIALTIQYQGMAELAGGSLTRAETLLAESLSIFESVEDQGRVITGRLLLARVAGLQGNPARAAELIGGALTMSSAPPMRRLILLAAEHATWLAGSVARPEAVARVLGAIDAMRLATGLRRDPVDAFAYGEAMRITGARSGDQTMQSWMAAAPAVPLDALVDETRALLAQVATVAAGTPAPQPDTGRLSKREYEVVQLVAQGFSNRQIAHALIISENTAKYHVTSILNKLGADSRARIVALAAQLNLLHIPS